MEILKSISVELSRLMCFRIPLGTGLGKDVCWRDIKECFETFRVFVSRFRPLKKRVLDDVFKC